MPRCVDGRGGGMLAVALCCRGDAGLDLLVKKEED